MEVKRFGLGLDKQDKWLRASRDGETKRRRDEVRAETSVSSSLDLFVSSEKLTRKLQVPSQGRLYYVRYALKLGWTLEQVHQLTKIDPWFLDQLQQLVRFEDRLCEHQTLEELPRELLFEAKQLGYSDAQLANLYLGEIDSDSILKVRRHRQSLGIEPVYKLVDTCAAEFEAATPYYYSTYEAPFRRGRDEETKRRSDEVKAGDADPPSLRHSVSSSLSSDDEIRVTDKPKIVILGGGPNRIGQGIEFDYCCVQAAFAAQELGFEAVMINSNPETVSTDYDTSDLLFFEPLTLEDVLNVVERLNGGPFGGRDEETKRGRDEAEDGGSSSLRHSVSSSLVHGVIVQFGGQTPLNLADGLQKAGVPIIGTSPESIDRTEDREQFAQLCRDLDIRQPENGIAHSADEAVAIAERIGYPVLVRPSFVLGGRAMETVFDAEQLRHYMAIAIGASDLAGQPILVDKFLFQATECDVDVVADFGGRDGGTEARRHEGAEARAVVCGVLEHIEEAGIHSGDSACATPPHALPPAVVEQIKRASRDLAKSLDVRGLMNVQWAVRRRDEETERSRDEVKEGSETSSLRHSVSSSLSDHEIYVIEVNPRASRTVPFIGKASGVQWAKLAAKVMSGKQLAELGVTDEVIPEHTAVKESVFPFGKFPGVDVILGPEMRSTGEVMGIDPRFPLAFAKSQMAALQPLPTEGKVFLTVRREDRDAAVSIGRRLVEMGFEVLCTGGTGQHLADYGVTTSRLNKISEGRPNALDLIKNGELAMIVNTPTRKGKGTDEGKLRATAVRFGVTMITTLTAAEAAVEGIAALRSDGWSVAALQDYAG